MSINCDNCGGTGLCPACLDDGGRCDQCRTTGACIQCKGKGIMPARPDPETQMVSMEDVKAIMDNHRRIVAELQVERDEADRRAGAAWRLLSRYKKRVRQLRGESYD